MLFIIKKLLEDDAESIIRAGYFLLSFLFYFIFIFILFFL